MPAKSNLLTLYGVYLHNSKRLRTEHDHAILGFPYWMFYLYDIPGTKPTYV